jgi:predicted dienelactone hydrolase
MSTCCRIARRRSSWILAGLALTGSALASAQVGMARVALGDLPVTLVYPTSSAATSQRFGAFELMIALEAPVAASAKRRPLIVMSHGTGGSEFADHTLAAALARGGFIVAQPLHPGDNYRDASRAGPDAWRTRPADVLRAIDGLTSHAKWGTLIDADRVGVHGTSAGGATALVLAGAQWRLLALLQHCGEHLAADVGFCLNGAADAETRARLTTC